MLTNKTILVTGGIGAFGHTFVPMTLAKYNPFECIKDGKRVSEGFSYASDNKTEWMQPAELQAWIDANRTKIGSV